LERPPAIARAAATGDVLAIAVTSTHKNGIIGIR
jgi:hypothetical protein